MQSQTDDRGTAMGPSDPPGETLLIVDDEANILTALRRVFRPAGYAVLTAASGAEGLEVLDREKVDLVISDMRMANMSGAEFLEQVQHRFPDAVRILLTGYADMESTIAAINKGRIYRYISKPWNDDDIVLTVRQALDVKRLEARKRELEAMTRRQNEELRALNASLDAKVRERTEALRQTMVSLEEAHEKLKAGFVATIRTFSNLVELRGKEMGGHSRRVADDACKIARHLGLAETLVADVVFAGLLHDIGKMGLPDALLRKPYAALRPEEWIDVVKHPVRGASALMGLEQFRGAAPFIRAHHERYDGKGFPEGLAGEDIPLGARILAVANEYDALQTGMLDNRRRTPEEALTFLLAHKATRYDPAIVDVFVELKTEVYDRQGDGDLDASVPQEALRSGQLLTGMVLARDLITRDGLLLLSKGHALNENIIEQIRNFEHSDGKALKVWVSHHVPGAVG